MSYDEYYDTDVEYIGTIPKTWDLVHNKHLFNKTKVIVGPNWSKYNVLSLTKQGVIIKDIENNQGKMPSDFSIYQIVNPGNLLMCLFDIDVTPRCVGYIENKGIVSAAYTELSSSEEIDMKYYYWWYLMLDIDKQLLHLSKNLRNSLSTEDFMALSVVKPPLKEQKQIANYLDNKTAKIDETIAKNEELIQLLEEKRIALINQAVTKGLNPDVAMKDSGVEWIGEIPEHWEINKLKILLNNLTDGAHSSVEILDDGYPYVTVTDLNETNETVDITNCKRISKEDYDFLVRNGCKPTIGDILFSQIGTIGLVVPVDNYDDYVLLSSVAILTLSKSSDRRWLIYYLRSLAIKEQWKQLLAGGAVKRITLQHISNFKIAVPPLSEQKQISQYLDNEISTIYQIISKIKKNINLLEEYKTSLIHHVVTGKVDVRGEEI